LWGFFALPKPDPNSESGSTDLDFIRIWIRNTAETSMTHLETIFAELMQNLDLLPERELGEFLVLIVLKRIVKIVL
jgi:hypothetical protein